MNLLNIFKKTKQSRKTIGKKGEKTALRFLSDKGYRLITKNYICKIGEIDLIMRENEELVIVEVRTVTNFRGNDYEECVPYSKRRQLIRLSRYFLTTLNDPIPSIRIDVVIIVLKPEMKIIHYINAIQVDRY